MCAICVCVVSVCVVSVCLCVCESVTFTKGDCHCAGGGAGMQVRVCGRLCWVYIQGNKGGRWLFIWFCDMPTDVHVVGVASTEGCLMMGLERVVFTYGTTYGCIVNLSHSYLQNF